MLIGPHCSKLDDINQQRTFMRDCGYGVFQTMFAGTRSYDVPLNREYRDPSVHPMWIWHVAYTASVNPSERSRAGCGEYLRKVVQCAQRMNIHAIVIHIGVVSGKTTDCVMTGIDEFLTGYGVTEELGQGAVKLAIEISACTCGISLNPEILAAKYGVCFDLAHTHAAGLGWTKLRKIIEAYPPVVVHANFCGSDFGSSRDIHGWRTHPRLQMEGRGRFVDRSDSIVEELTDHYDRTIRLLAALGVPMIVEGSGFVGGSVASEIQYLRSIV